EEALMTIERSRGIGFARIADLAASSTTSAANSAARQSLAAASTKFAQARNRLGEVSLKQDQAGKEAAEIAFLDSERELTRARDGLFASVSTSQRATRPAAFADLRGLASRHPDTLFLEWTSFDSGTLLFALSQRDGLKAFSLPSTLPQISGLLERWDQSLRRGRNTRGMKLVGPTATESEESDLAKQVYQIVLGPASALLGPPFARLVLIADGPILRIPF